MEKHDPADRQLGFKNACGFGFDYHESTARIWMWYVLKWEYVNVVLSKLHSDLIT